MIRRQFRPPGAVLVVLAAMAWGTTGTTRALGAEHASPYAVGAVRLALGGGLLLAVAYAQGFRFRPHAWPRGPLAVAIAAIAGYQPLFFAGVGRAGVAVGTVVGIGSAPIFGGLLGRVLRHEELGGHWYVATALGIAGAVLLGGGGEAGEQVGVGLALAVGAGFAYAVYVAASAALLDEHEPAHVAAVVLGAGGVLLVPVALVAGVGWLGDGQGAAAALWLGVVTVFLAYPLLARGLAEVGVGATATLTLAEPATAALLGIVVLDERLSAGGWSGLVLVAAGVAVEATRGRNRRRVLPS